MLIFYSGVEWLFFVAFFPFGDAPEPELYMPIFRNTVSVQSSEAMCGNTTNEDGKTVPKGQHIKLRHQRIAKKKEQNIHTQGKFGTKTLFL